MDLEIGHFGFADRRYLEGTAQGGETDFLAAQTLVAGDDVDVLLHDFVPAVQMANSRLVQMNV